MLSREEIAESNIFVRKDGSYVRWNTKTHSWEKICDAPKRYFCFICGSKIDNILSISIYEEKDYPPESIWCCRCKSVWEYYVKFKDKFDKFIIQKAIKNE